MSTGRDDGAGSGLHTIFGQLFSGLRRTPYQLFATAPPHAQLWNVTLAGEGSIDVGGAFRETLTLACSDLMAGAPSLFIENPNSVNGVGLNREKRIINPRASSPLHLEMFRCVVVRGHARRSCVLRFDVVVVVCHVVTWPGCRLIGSKSDSVLVCYLGGTTVRQYIVGGHRRWSYICAFWVAHLHYVYVLSCRFVGALFAMSLRSKFTLPLDLAVTVWKQVLDEPLTDDDLDRSVAICVGLARLAFIFAVHHTSAVGVI